MISFWHKLSAKREVLQPTPAGEINRRFWQAEDDRTQTFENTRRQQLLELASAAQKWMQVEMARNESFRQVVDKVKTNFVAEEEKRSSDFQLLMEKNDVRFRSYEKERNMAFSEMLGERWRLFNTSQEKRERACEKLFQFLEQLYERGRSNRETECKQLAVHFAEHFDQMMQKVKADFRKAQQLREQRVLSGPPGRRIVNGIVTPLPRPMVDSPMPRPPERSLSRICSRSPYSRSPSVRRRPLRRSHTASPVQILVPPRTPIPQPTIVMPVPEKPLPQLESSNSSLAKAEAMDLLDDHFLQGEEQRNLVFSGDKLHRDQVYRQIVDYVNEGDRIRRSHVRDVEDFLSQAYTKMRASYDQVFQDRLELYARAEDVREKKYSDADRQMQLVDEDLVAWLLVEATNAANTHSQALQSSYGEIEGLMDGMGDAVKETQSSFDHEFDKFMDKHVPRPGSPSVFEPAIPPSKLPTPDRSPSPSSYRRRRTGRRERSSRSRSRSRRHSRSPPSPRIILHEERGRRLSYSSTQSSPVRTGGARAGEAFSPQVLLRGNAFSNQLPIAGVGPTQPGDEPEIQIQQPAGPGTHGNSPTPGVRFRHRNLFHTHYSVFAKSQAQRATQFTTHMHKLHQDTTEVHIRYDLQFRELLVRLDKFVASKWLEYQGAFLAEQQKRDEEFERREKERAKGFAEQMKGYTGLFQASHSRRALSFAQAYKQVHEKAVGDEKNRVKAFVRWKEKMKGEMERKISEWKGELELEEASRQKRFSEVFG